MNFPNRLDFRFDVILWNFSNLSACLRLWLCLFLSTCTIIYSCYHIWAYKRLSFISIGSKEKSTSLSKNFIGTFFSSSNLLLFSSI